ncbi:potassium-transporting ATPase subunit KdpA [Clostridium folliculivorans]|uniref:Potassium-transporting ATPase potassium-binding subunit n=1 Tax=Clostridium folliculivorans TaxID=2886038 RepID=A0A9W5XZC7_9CLOT|nr:potassium-transporting ATPase subunit KdpA [Clostridium folliculivorans]GKU23738.1 potassium-transporting ATPase potassium-binding subunit [Clostridium folliculivorans]GKU29854.1 potassium-transporting ATPase potassium-binding subunit [Clostridium folliculivorans]
MDILQIVITLVLFILLILPMSRYLYKVATGEKSFVDPVLDKVDNFIFKITGVNKEEMNWKKYAATLLISNGIMVAIGYVILRVQGIGLLNPNKIGGMEQSLSFNTAISFITNTNLQDYSGESGLSYLSQMIVIIFLMFTSAATGFAAALAFIRGLTGRTKTVGNFFVDIVRIITRVFIPLSIVVSIILMWQGVPQTLSPNITVNTIEGKLQDIAVGPVAALEAIKHIGTNGGGFFGANSAHPFENPTPITNLIEILSMMLLPGSLVLTFGLMLKNKKQGWTIFAAMSLLFIIVLPVAYFAEKAGNPALAHIGLSQALGNMEGKEVRFGIAQSSLFTTVTTAFTTGTVNNMHDSLTPLGGMVALWNMMINVVFGGKGVGLMGMIMYAILSVFLCGLMIGRTPEFLRKKIEGKEMKLIALAIIVHPLIILIPTGLALVTKSGLAGITNPGYHGLSQVLYQFTSSAANNGSGFEGLADNTVFWNSITGFVMLFGRYVSMILLLAVAGSLAQKQLLPENEASFKTDNKMFVFILVAIVIIIGALTFLPALALGPVSEHLTLGR